MFPGMPVPFDKPLPTPDDLVQLRRLYEGGRHTVMAADVQRWRACGWIEPEPSWRLTPEGCRLIDEPPIAPGSISWRDPGPDHRPSPAVRPRTPEEVRPARRALLKLSDALLATSATVLRAEGRLAWLLSVLPLSTPEEVGDAVEFVGRVLARKLEGEPDRAALFAMADLCRLVDDMRAEVQGSTDRRRSVRTQPSTPPGDQTVYTVKIQTTCRACAFALAGQAPLLGTIRAAFVTQSQEDPDVQLTIHANSGWVKSHDGTPYACPEHGRYFDLSAEPT